MKRFLIVPAATLLAVSTFFPSGINGVVRIKTPQDFDSHPEVDISLKNIMEELINKLPVDQDYVFKDFQTTVIGRDGSEKSITINGGKEQLQNIDERIQKQESKYTTHELKQQSSIVYDHVDEMAL
eukprot:403347636